MSRRTLGFLAVGGLVALGILVSVVPVSGSVGAVLFAVAVGLAGVLFFRFHPQGDTWDEAEELGVSPWLYVAAIITLAAVFFVVRFAVVQST